MCYQISEVSGYNLEESVRSYSLFFSIILIVLDNQDYVCEYIYIKNKLIINTHNRFINDIFVKLNQCY